MLHWNSWWVHKEGTKPVAVDQPPLPADPAAWTPEAWLAWQFKLWSQSWEASLAWWTLYGMNSPSLPWLQALFKRAEEEAAIALPPPAAKPPVRRPKAIASERPSGSTKARLERLPAPPPQ